MDDACSAWNPYLKKDVEQWKRLQNKEIFQLREQSSFTEIGANANITLLKEDQHRNLWLNL